MAKIVKLLTNTQVRQSKLNSKTQNLTSDGGLYLHISKAGSKAWRIDFTTPVTKKRVTMTLGQYPEIILMAATQMRENVIYNLSNGDDPRKLKIKRFKMIVEFLRRSTSLSNCSPQSVS